MLVETDTALGLHPAERGTYSTETTAHDESQDTVPVKKPK